MGERLKAVEVRQESIREDVREIKVILYGVAVGVAGMMVDIVLRAFGA